MCDDLAALAAAMEGAVSDAQDAMTAAITGTRASMLAREVAGRFVEQVTAAPADQVATVVRGIRICGVVLCGVGGRGMDRCRCLSALTASIRADVADAAVDAAVQRVLQRGLEPFLPAAEATG